MAGTLAFVWTVWRMGVHVYRAAAGEESDLVAFLAEVALGTGLVIASYLVDLGVVWLRRGKLVPR